MARADLTPMMKPRSVAIIGASRDPAKVGNVILQNYIGAGYEGKLYPVNPNADEILGRKAYKTVLEIKDTIDLAVIAIPAPLVPKVLEQCGKAKVRSAVVVSGGFAEVGETELQEKITEIAKKYKIAMIGPNCLGVMDTRSKVDTLFLPMKKISRPKVGYVSFVSQSGAVGSTVLDVIAGEGFGLSKFVSYGNAAYLDETDILEYLMNDEETKVIVVYLEGIKRGKEFVELARKITKVKPVVVLKAGRTEAGTAAAHSHTAALAGNYAVQEAIFKQFGFTVASDLSELIYYAKIFASEVKPKGNRVAVITNGGGAGVVAADEIASSRYLKMAELSAGTKKSLRKVMPALVNMTDPLDLAGDADSRRYGDALNALGADPNIDMLMVIVLYQTPGADPAVTHEIVQKKITLNKPLLVVSVGTEYTHKQTRLLEDKNVPVYDSPISAVDALEALFEYAEYKSRH
ncbi:MAG: CoA-binding protein [Candidatus Micrarchaeota archaeon]|nr:CoA-binding protein [Candidatus Micrarchaeota archaeon]